MYINVFRDLASKVRLRTDVSWFIYGYNFYLGEGEGWGEYRTQLADTEDLI